MEGREGAGLLFVHPLQGSLFFGHRVMNQFYDLIHSQQLTIFHEQELVDYGAQEVYPLFQPLPATSTSTFGVILTGREANIFWGLQY